MKRVTSNQLFANIIANIIVSSKQIMFCIHSPSDEGQTRLSFCVILESAPFILASTGDFCRPPVLPCGPAANANQYLKLSFPWSYWGVHFFVFRLDVCSLRYEVKHASFPDKLSFSSLPPNSALLKSYNQIKKHTSMFTHVVCK